MKFFIPVKGDIVRVRTIGNRIVDAVYGEKHKNYKFHSVFIDGRLYWAGHIVCDSQEVIDDPVCDPFVRFVGPGAVMESRS